MRTTAHLVVRVTGLAMAQMEDLTRRVVRPWLLVSRSPMVSAVLSTRLITCQRLLLPEHIVAQPVTRLSLRSPVMESCGFGTVWVPVVVAQQVAIPTEQLVAAVVASQLQPKLLWRMAAVRRSLP